MKKILSVLSVMLILASCGGGYNPPSFPNNQSTEASFRYEIVQPLTVITHNTSTNASSYFWDFGDGTTSTEKNPTHKYKSKGVYEINMTAKGYDSKSSCYATVTIKEPTKCYITGLIYERIPMQNEYYNIRLTDDYLLFETLYLKTNWSLLSSANLPYSYIFSEKFQLDFNKKSYVLRLYTNTSASGTGSEIANWNLYPSNLKSDFSEKLSGTVDNAKISVLLEWRD